MNMTHKAFNVDEFIHQVNQDFLKTQHQQRYGQFLVNSLRDQNFDLYSQMPESADCFYDGTKCAEFLKWIYSQND